MSSLTATIPGVIDERIRIAYDTAFISLDVWMGVLTAL